MEREITVTNKTGLHARPASLLASLCQRFDSEITMINNSIHINPKSIISILTGGVNKGTKVLICVEGPDEVEAMKQICEFIEGLEE